MKTSKPKPLVLLPADVKQIGHHPYHAVGQKYILAVAQAAHATPLVVPAISEYLNIPRLMAMADGIVLTGSVSNLHPSYFNQTVHDESLPLDLARDALTMQLIKAAIENSVPILAICRGFQEMNVAFGGTLHQAVHEVAGFNDHRALNDESAEMQYAHAHSVQLMPNGKLARMVGKTTMQVNSIHGQGIDQLGIGLTAEAHAPDGLIESISVNNANTFALGVQWHPEWQVMQNNDYLAIFKAFGDACRAKLERHKPPD